MQNNPAGVATQIAAYLNTPDQAPVIEASLRTGSLERSGTGLVRTQLSETGWTENQTETFLRLCGPTMQRFGYEL